MGYVKLYSSTLKSSLWCAAKETRILFLTLLMEADAAGFVEGSLVGIARIANLSLDETTRAMDELLAPDPHSHSPECEGRRVTAVPGGWMLVNYTAYRERRDDAAKRAYMRRYMRERRQTSPVVGAPTCQQLSFVNNEAVAVAVAVADKQKQRVLIPDSLNTAEFREAWQRWQEYRRADKRKPVTPTMAREQLKQLAQYGPTVAIGAISASIANGWQGLFPAKEAAGVGGGARPNPRRCDDTTGSRPAPPGMRF